MDSTSSSPGPGTVSSSGSDADNQSKLRFALQARPACTTVLIASPRTLLGILRRFVGVADIASVRFSLPSQLLEPVPNLGNYNVACY